MKLPSQYPPATFGRKKRDVEAMEDYDQIMASIGSGRAADWGAGNSCNSNCSCGCDCGNGAEFTGRSSIFR